MKPQIKTQEGVIDVSWDLTKIAEEYFETILEGRVLIINEEEREELYELFHKYMDDLANHPDYSNYN